MAELKGANATKIADPQPSNILERGKVAGVVKVMTETYDASVVNITDADNLVIGKTLKAGDIVIGAFITTSKNVSSCDIILGDSDDEDRYGTVSINSAAAVNQPLVAYAGHNYVIGSNDGDTVIRLKMDETFNGAVKVTVLYIES
jgi:hypothetical protein